jgi:hypothetical protein
LATPFYLKKTGGFVRCGGSDVYAEEDGPSQQISGAELTKVSILGANGGCLLLPLEPRSIAKGSTSGPRGHHGVDQGLGSSIPDIPHRMTQTPSTTTSPLPHDKCGGRGIYPVLTCTCLLLALPRPPDPQTTRPPDPQTPQFKENAMSSQRRSERCCPGLQC